MMELWSCRTEYIHATIIPADIEMRNTHDKAVFRISLTQAHTNTHHSFNYLPLRVA